MKLRLLELLVCPETGEELKLTSFTTTSEAINNQMLIDTVEGVLVSVSGRVYPVIDGVPRMIDGAFFLYQSFRSKWNNKLQELGLVNKFSLQKPDEQFLKFILPTLTRFEKEWSEHELNGLTWNFDPPTRIKHFLHYMNAIPDDLQNKLVLDAGAGTGQTACNYTTLGCEVVGIDLSPAVVRGWLARKKLVPHSHQHLHIVQGNLLKPPFRKNTFDFIHSSGVLHHTPDTRNAFNKVAVLTKRGGKFSVWIYKIIPDAFLPIIPFVPFKFLSLSIARLRKFTPSMNPALLHGLISFYCHYQQAAYKLNNLLRGKNHKQTAKERATSLFDTLAPPFVWKHTPAEVMNWFTETGYTEIKDTSLPTELYGFNICATKL